MEQIKEKVEGIATPQADLGMEMRQFAAEAVGNSKEVKEALNALGDGIATSFASLDQLVGSQASSSTTEEMSAAIKAAVQASIANLGAAPGLTDELKEFITSAITDCGVASNVSGDDEETKQHLLAMVATLLELRDDVKNVSAEIAEVRNDLKEVNATLGGHNEMLRCLLAGKNNTPSLVVIFPAVVVTNGSVYKYVKSKVANVTGAFTKKVVVVFVCPVTKKPARSGPKGTATG